MLKDTEKRARYDQILEFGLPDWRQPIFYFRKARKLGFFDLVIIFSVVVSIGHYFVMWAQYLEHKLTIVKFIFTLLIKIIILVYFFLFNRLIE